jgi:hypothetical protein
MARLDFLKDETVELKKIWWSIPLSTPIKWFVRGAPMFVGSYSYHPNNCWCISLLVLYHLNNCWFYIIPIIVGSYSYHPLCCWLRTTRRGALIRPKLAFPILAHTLHCGPMTRPWRKQPNNASLSGYNQQKGDWNQKDWDFSNKNGVCPFSMAIFWGTWWSIIGLGTQFGQSLLVIMSPYQNRLTTGMCVLHVHGGIISYIVKNKNRFVLYGFLRDIHIWRFPKMGLPQNHGFQYKSCLIWDDLGYPYFRTPPHIKIHLGKLPILRDGHQPIKRDLYGFVLSVKAFDHITQISQVTPNKLVCDAIELAISLADALLSLCINQLS